MYSAGLDSADVTLLMKWYVPPASTFLQGQIPILGN